MRITIYNGSSTDLQVRNSSNQVVGFVLAKTDRDFDFSGSGSLYKVTGQLVASFSFTSDSQVYVNTAFAVTGSGNPLTAQILGHPLPSWAQSSPNASLFYMGIFLAVTVRLTRAGLRWFKAVGRQDFS